MSEKSDKEKSELLKNHNENKFLLSTLDYYYPADAFFYEYLSQKQWSTFNELYSILHPKNIKKEKEFFIKKNQEINNAIIGLLLAMVKDKTIRREVNCFLDMCVKRDKNYHSHSFLTYVVPYMKSIAWKVAYYIDLDKGLSSLEKYLEECEKNLSRGGTKSLINSEIFDKLLDNEKKQFSEELDKFHGMDEVQVQTIFNKLSTMQGFFNDKKVQNFTDQDYLKVIQLCLGYIKKMRVDLIDDKYNVFDRKDKFFLNALLEKICIVDFSSESMRRFIRMNDASIIEVIKKQSFLTEENKNIIESFNLFYNPGMDTFGEGMLEGLLAAKSKCTDAESQKYVKSFENIFDSLFESENEVAFLIKKLTQFNSKTPYETLIRIASVCNRDRKSTGKVIHAINVHSFYDGVVGRIICMKKGSLEDDEEENNENSSEETQEEKSLLEKIKKDQKS